MSPREGQEVPILAVPNGNGNADADREPYAAMRYVAEMLAGRGLDVHRPEGKESRLLTVTAAGRGRCEIGADDDGSVSWTYFFQTGAHTQPAEISGMVLRLLGAAAHGFAGQYADLHRGATLKGAVAREIHARGLGADLEVTEDQAFYDVVAEVILTNPARPERGLVRITDDGTIRWEYDHGDMPERAAAIADTTADVLATPS